MLIDEAEVILKGGHGGPGKVSFYRPPQRGPDGGNGGKGGDLYIKVVSDMTALRPYTSKRLLQAEDGKMGEGNRKFGKNGADLEIIMPVGTTLIDQKTGEEIELTVPDQTILFCKGGLGGRGNFEFKSPRVTTPEFAQTGLEGEEKHYKVSLKFIADIGLIGLPNAGKSSLLNELTRAQAKVADYPFTTLEPNLGVFHGKVIADIPGLIEGAHTGKGLGIKFLKHIEKVRVLIHCISAQADDIKKDYQVIRDELKQYDRDLAKKKEIILVTKSDLATPEKIKELVGIFKAMKKKALAISIHDWDSLEKLKQVLG